MTIASNDWFEQIKYYVHAAVGQSLSVIEGTVTSRQLSPPSVKVMLEPYGIETGWIRVGVPYAGVGYGFLAIPPDGQAVKVIFDMGDKNSASVVCDVYNDVDTPPTLSDIDDCVFQHKSGSKLYFHVSGDVEVVPAGNLILGGGTSPVARKGDTVSVPINVSGTTSDGASYSVSTTATGTISSGSSNVQA